MTWLSFFLLESTMNIKTVVCIAFWTQMALRMKCADAIAATTKLFVMLLSLTIRFPNAINVLNASTTSIHKQNTLQFSWGLL